MAPGGGVVGLSFVHYGPRIFLSLGNELIGDDSTTRTGFAVFSDTLVHGREAISANVEHRTAGNAGVIRPVIGRQYSGFLTITRVVEAMFGNLSANHRCCVAFAECKCFSTLGAFVHLRFHVILLCVYWL